MLHNIALLHYLSQAANEWLGDCSDIPDDAWSDEVEQRVFSTWRAKTLRRAALLILLDILTYAFFFSGLCGWSSGTGCGSPAG
mgnify:CR=1 FL=1